MGSSASSQMFDDEPDDSDDDLESHLSPHEISQLTDSLNKVRFYIVINYIIKH